MYFACLYLRISCTIKSVDMLTEGGDWVVALGFALDGFRRRFGYAVIPLAPGAVVELPFPVYG